MTNDPLQGYFINSIIYYINENETVNKVRDFLKVSEALAFLASRRREQTRVIKIKKGGQAEMPAFGRRVKSSRLVPGWAAGRWAFGWRTDLPAVDTARWRGEAAVGHW